MEQERQAWRYDPGSRRVRRAPDIAYDNPGTNSDGLATADQFGGFNGSPDRYDWQVVKKQEAYIPYNNYRLGSPDLDYDDIVRPRHINQDLVRYELHRVWVLEATLRPDARHLYSRRTFYIDEDSWQIAVADRALQAEERRFAFQAAMAERYVALGNDLLDINLPADARQAFETALTYDGNSLGAAMGLFKAGLFTASKINELVGFGATALPREDVGSTLPAGALTAFAGLVLLTGLVGPGWTWDLGWEDQVTFTAEFMVPTLTLFCALVSGWAAAKAYGGFGARGRHVGAYVLVYLNAVSIIAVLFLLVAFTVLKGVPGVLNGAEVGLGVGPATTLAFTLVVPFVDVALFGFSYTVVWPVSVPFVMNGVALLNDVNGVLPAIAGTFWLVVGAVVFAVPIGVGTAVFVTEYAERGRFTQVVEVATNALWSTPSIVFGLFGFAFLIPRFRSGKSLLAGMLTLGFMLLPLVIITSREAMLAVPDEYRDASAALGVSKWQTIRSVVLPAALPGVITGVILGVGRIAGETAPILLTMAGGTFVPGGQTVDVIGGYAALLEEELGSDLGERHREILRALRGQSANLSTRTDQLLEISRIRTAGLRLGLEEINLRHIVGELSRSRATAADRHEIRLETRLDPSAPTFVIADPDCLRGEILGNLLDNALKYSPPGGTVSLTVSGRGGEAVFEIADQGPPIPAEALPHVFDRYFRGRDESGRTGAGLALPVARAGVEAHGGTIQVENPDDGGALFRIVLPLHPSMSTAASEGAA